MSGCSRVVRTTLRSRDRHNCGEAAKCEIRQQQAGWLTCLRTYVIKKIT